MTTLDGLNAAQSEATQHTTGPALITAGAGSGKTRVLTLRTQFLIEEAGVEPDRIVLLTFTRKAADEMRDRLNQAMGGLNTFGIAVGTIHSICYRILRHYWDQRQETYEILSGYPQKKLFKTLLAAPNRNNPHGLNWDLDLKLALGRISYWKNALVMPEDLDITLPDGALWRELYLRYEAAKHQAGQIDLDDMLVKTWHLLETNTGVRRHWQAQWAYVLTDEAQDSSLVQWRIIESLAAPENNLFVVGDSDQCWDVDQIVHTTQGPKLISDLSPGDQVETIRHGRRDFAPVTHVGTIDASPILIIETPYRTLRVSPWHKVFVSLPEFADRFWYLYVMWRPDKGYRIGVTTGGKTHRIGNRTASEHPQKLWILAQYHHRHEAEYWEQLFSLHYQIPTQPFIARNGMISQEQLDTIFHEFGLNGAKLLEDHYMHPDYPHWMPQGTVQGTVDRRSINLTLNAGKCEVHVSYESQGERIRKWFTSDRAYLRGRQYAAELLSTIDNTMIHERFRVAGRGYFPIVTASGVFPTCQIPVLTDRGIQLEVVTQVTQDTAQVRDVEVGDTGIMVVNGIPSHNSIFAFRGGRPDYLSDFADRFPSARTIALDINYRSLPYIVTLGNHLINWNPRKIPKAVQPQRTGSVTEPTLWTPDDEDEEGLGIAQLARTLHDEGATRWRDIACIYRTNAQSQPIEDALIAAKIPYQILGGFGFWGRKEVQDLLAYLRVLEDPHDVEAYQRALFNPSRYLGKVFVSQVLEFAQRTGSDLITATRNCPAKPFQQRAAREWVNMMQAVQPITKPADRIMAIRDLADYDAWFVKQDTGDEDDTERMGNLEALVRVAGRFDTTADLLGHVEQAQQPPQDEDRQRDQVTLLTIHRAKGLEWPVVILPGFLQGVLPHKHALSEDDPDTNPAGLQEERRLAYVAITRARDMLVLSAPVTRFGQTTEPSQFLGEMGLRVPGDDDETIILPVEASR